MNKKTPSNKRLILWGTGLSAIAVLILIVVFLFAGNRKGEGMLTGEKDYPKKAAVLAASPEDYTKQDYDKQQQFLEEHPVEPSFYEALEEFTFQTFDAFREESPQKENFLYSPLSLYYALATAAEGAAGETKAELLRLLAVTEEEKLAEQCRNLYACLYRENEESTFRIANSLWMAEEFQGRPISWNDAFLKTASMDFYASLFSVDFQDGEAAHLMTEWVSDQTNGLLQPEFQTEPRIQPDGSVYEQLLGILNTVYIKDGWGSRFRDKEERQFFLENGTQKEVTFLKKGADGNVYRGTNYRRASLWLQHLGEMVFVLPEEGMSVEELLGSPEQLREAFCGGEPVQAEIIWQVPQFTCEMEQDLKEALQKLGVECAFEEETADFSHLADVDLFVSEVRQGTRLAIDENGIEAAAYSYIAMSNTGAAGEPEKLEQIEMILNRPFLYGIVYQGVYVFVGVCGNP